METIIIAKIDWDDILLDEEEDLADQSLYEIEVTKVQEKDAPVDVAASGSKKKRKSRRNLTEMQPHVEGDEFSIITQALPINMPGTASGRRTTLNRVNTYFTLSCERHEDLPDMVFTDDNLALLLAEIGRQLDYGKSTLKTTHAAIGEWLSFRGKPRYSNSANSHLYPKVMQTMKVKKLIFKKCL